MHFDFSPSAWEDYLHWQQADRQLLKRINALLQDIARNKNAGIGKPEALKGNLSGLWSRRINDKHRLVYVIENEACVIYQCRGHYGDF